MLWIILLGLTVFLWRFLVISWYDNEYHIGTSMTVPPPFTDATFMTYNVQYLPLYQCPTPHLQELMSSAPQVPHIICLQEYHNQNDWCRTLSVFSDYHMVRSNSKSWCLANSGLVILTQYPILEHHFETYRRSNPASLDYFADKGILCALLWCPKTQGTFYMVNTHLQSSDYKQFDTFAVRQLYQLATFLNKLQYPWVLTGDFNMDPDQVMGHLGSMVSCRLHVSSEPTIYTNLEDGTSSSSCRGPNDQPRRFEFFITSTSPSFPCQSRQIQVLDGGWSDHRPVKWVVKQ